MYKLMTNVLSGQISQVIRTTDNAFIPFDPQNVDYQAYLQWLSEGNQPLPADEA